MRPKLYLTEASPAARGTLLLVKALKLDIELIPVSLTAKENLTPEYLKMNPQHTVPTLRDGNFVIWDSHAINAYLADKYAEDDSLYPKDLQKRAIINQRLHFNWEILFPRGFAIVFPIIREGAKSVPEEKARALFEGYVFLETFLEGNEYVAGDYLSIADLNIVALISTENILVPISEDKFPNISRWWSRMTLLPFYKEGNQVGLDEFEAFVKSKLT